MAGTRNYDFLVRLPVRFGPRPAPANLHADQAPLNRRLGRRQIMLSATIQRRLLHTLVHHDDWHRLQDPHH
jgi:hypothetical protein